MVDDPGQADAHERIRTVRRRGLRAGLVIRLLGAAGSIAVLTLIEHPDAVVSPLFAVAFIATSTFFTTTSTSLTLSREHLERRLLRVHIAADLANMLLVVAVLDPSLTTGAWVLALVPIGEATLLTRRPRAIVATALSAAVALGVMGWAAEGAGTAHLGRLALVVFLGGGPISVMLAQTLVLQDALVKSHLARDRLCIAATHDELTGLLNRRGFVESFAAGDPVAAVLFIDLDGFKGINDRYGHEAGDTVLRVVAERYSQVLRPTDVVARLGGDEFAVLLRNADRSKALEVAVRLQDRTQDPISLPSRTCTLSASVGVAMVDNDATPVLDWLDLADASMYQRKHKRQQTQNWTTSIPPVASDDPLGSTQASGTR